MNNKRKMKKKCYHGGSSLGVDSSLLPERATEETGCPQPRGKNGDDTSLQMVGLGSSVMQWKNQRHTP
jgi:hypothetical protein